MVLRSIALQAAKEDNFKLALEAVEVARGLAVETGLQGNLAEDFSAITLLSGSGDCYFCEEAEACPADMVQYPMYKITAKTPTGVRYATNTVKVPRCGRCELKHYPGWLWAGWAALFGAVIGPLVGAAASAAGFSALIIGIGIPFIQAAREGDVRVGLIGVCMIIGGLMNFPAVFVSAEASSLLAEIFGGAAALSGIAFVIGWFNKTKVETLLEDHQGYLSLLKDGFTPGSKPPGYS